MRIQKVSHFPKRFKSVSFCPSPLVCPLPPLAPPVVPPFVKLVKEEEEEERHHQHPHPQHPQHHHPTLEEEFCAERACAFTLTSAQNQEILNAVLTSFVYLYSLIILQNLSCYLGAEFTNCPPHNEKTFQLYIKDPMVYLFCQLKKQLQSEIGRPIENQVFEFYEGCKESFLVLILSDVNGNIYFESDSPDSCGPTANTYKNSPLESNQIGGIFLSETIIAPSNTNLNPASTAVLQSEDPTYTQGLVYFDSHYKTKAYRAVRELYNSKTGIIGGYLTAILLNY